MDEKVPDSPVFSLDDLLDHSESFGIDLYPPIDLSRESVRAQAFFAELRDRWPHLYGSMTLGSTDFKIGATFPVSGGRQAALDTFTLRQRGPLFVFPHRLGRVRNVIFACGQVNCAAWLGGRVLEFGAGRLASAQCTLVYQDGPLNIGLQLGSVQQLQQTPVPVTGQLVSSPNQFCLAVVLDVNNRDVHPLTLEERQEILTRAGELWPGRLLQFLNRREFQ